MEYENCKAYKIKEQANGICRGNDNDIGEYDEKCNTCPAYLRYKNVLRMEKVINELNECIEHIRKNKFNKIPFWGNCQIAMMDALALLKEQEPKPVELHTNAYGTKFYFCPKCKRELFHTRNLNFCERCGQAVKWE